MKISQRIVKAGAWGYGPFDSDSALDFCWELDKEFLQKIGEALKDEGLHKAMVLAYLLTLIENNSVDETKALYRKIRPILLSRIIEECPNWKNPELKRIEWGEIIEKLDDRILADSGHTGGAKNLSEAERLQLDNLMEP